MNINDITVEDVRAMTDEERAELNKKLVRKLGKKILTQLAVGATVAVGLHFALKRLDASADAVETIDTPAIQD